MSSHLAAGPTLVSPLTLLDTSKTCATRGASSRGLRVVSFGGGTGLSTLLRGLKPYISPKNSVAAFPDHQLFIDDLTAVVAVTDDGGSSGRLRSDLSILPPGDIRNCLVALAGDETVLSKMFDYRFGAGHGLEGHSFGNLFLAVLSSLVDDFHQAVTLSSSMLGIEGRVLPATVERTVQLAAELNDGTTVVGETSIAASSAGVRRLRLDPQECAPLPQTLEAIADADLITVGPGSLYTSLLPHLLVKGIPEAIAASKATKVFICNIMTQPYETIGYSAADHLRVLSEHCGAQLFDAIVVNCSPIPEELFQRYKAESSEPVRYDADELQSMGVNVLKGEYLLSSEATVARHDARKVAADLMSFWLAANQESSLEIGAAPGLAA